MGVCEEIFCKVSGRVQMVMYRDFVQRKAAALGVVGTIRNMPDGTVEVVAQGAPEALKQFIERLHEGSVLAKVEDVAVEWRSPSRFFDEFSIVY